MRLAIIALVLCGWAVFDLPSSEPPREVYTAVVSAYSCDAHPANPMFPCGAFRDGTQPTPARHGVVAACPVEWLGSVIEIEGYGAVVCRDTPRHGWYGDKPHIDLFLPFNDAIEWGIRERTIYHERE